MSQERHANDYLQTNREMSERHGHRQLSVPDRELTKPIFGYFDGKLSSIASILINGLSYCLVKLHTSLSSIATLFYLE